MHSLVAVTLLAALASATPIHNSYYFSDIPSTSVLKGDFLRSSAFEKPIFVATPTAGSSDDLTATLIDGGYRSLAVLPQFRSLRNNLLAGEKTVFLVNPSSRSVSSVLPLKHLIVPEHYTTLMRSAQDSIMSHPIIVLLDQNDLKSNLFSTLKRVNAVDVTDDSMQLIKSALIDFEPAHTLSGLRSYAVEKPALQFTSGLRSSALEHPVLQYTSGLRSSALEHPVLQYTSGLRSSALEHPALQYTSGLRSSALNEPALQYNSGLRSYALEHPALQYSSGLRSNEEPALQYAHIAVEEPAFHRASGLQYVAPQYFAYPQEQKSLATPYLIKSVANTPYSPVQRIAAAAPSYVIPQTPVSALNYQPAQRFAPAVPYAIPQESVLVNPNYAALQGVQQDAFTRSAAQPTFYIVLNNDLANSKRITEEEAIKLLSHGKMGLVNMDSLSEVQKSNLHSTKGSGLLEDSAHLGSGYANANAGAKSSGSNAETVTKTVEKTIITSTGNAIESAAKTGAEAMNTAVNRASGIAGEHKLDLLGGIVKTGSEIVGTGANVLSGGAQEVAKVLDNTASSSHSRDSSSSGGLLGGLLNPVVKTGADLLGTGASAVDSAASHLASAVERSPLGVL